MDNISVPKDVLPTLVIGLGGTGYQVIKRLKQLFKKRYRNEKLPVRYLLIDTDLKSFLDDSIENNEKCQLRFGDGIKNTLEWAYSNPNFDWLPKNPEITPDFFTSTDQGAGLMRPIGRLYLCKNAKFVYDVLSTAKNDLVDLHKVLTDLGSAYLENIDRHKVYIVGSLAGGTGCGTFLDVAVMLSKIFNRDNTNIIGMFTLESCYDDKLSSDVDAQNRSKANCYAALKELEFYMSSITDPNDEKYLFKYNNVGEIKLEKKLLDVCYLIENKNELGGVLSNIEDIYDLCSLQLFQEVGTKLGSQLRADYANFICKDKDPVLKKDRHFSTFSSSTMEFPIESLKKYCSLRLAKEVIERLGRIDSEDESVLALEAEKILSEINEATGFNDYVTDFAGNLKINDKLLVKEIKENRKGNLDKAHRFAEEKRLQWQKYRSAAKNEMERLLKEYVSEGASKLGVKMMLEVLSCLEKEMYSEYIESAVNSSLDKEKLKGEIDKAETTKGFIMKEELTISRELSGRFNKYIEQEQNRLKHDMFKARYDMYIELKSEITGRFHEVLSNMANMRSSIDDTLNRMSCQSEKRYGGNIISREMVTAEFYEEFYLEKFIESLEDRIKAMLCENNLFELIQGTSDNIVRICEREFEKLKGHLDIMKVFQRNADKEGISLRDYVKEELDVTAKLAKPFWSAIKNPEVAWTECYYIGSIKDEAVNNDFTVKPPESIDRWIRNQTGERSRQARYVETTNPYAIDVIHITMGACAAYLPDIKSYKQFYLKLLASETYPLHLNEKYVGLEELDMSVDKLLQYFSLAKAYGAILEVENKYYLNLRTRQGRYHYVYYSPYCLKEAYAEERLQEIPENKTKLREDLYLGESKDMVLQHINDDTGTKAFLYGFIDEVERIFTKEELKKHCMEAYIKGKAAPDFISKEKLLHRLSVK